MRPPSLLASLAIHTGVFIALMGAPTLQLPPPAPSEYKQAIAGKEARLVWYKLPEKLPAVNSEAPRKERRQLRSETIAPQTIVSSPLSAPRAPRMVWTEGPTIEPSQLPDTANMIAVLERPLPPKPFTAPRDIVRPPAPDISVPDAADLAPGSLAQPALAVKLPPKPYVPPRLMPRALPNVELATDAPRIEAALTPAPSITSGKLPPKPFAPPTTQARAAKDIDVGAPPAISADIDKLNVAVIGLKPTTEAALPAYSSPAAFSGGETIRKDGATSDGRTNGLQVPDLFVRPTLLARANAAPTATGNIREALRAAQPIGAVPGATRVSSAPTDRFNNRTVYMMAIQMPNLTSYSGSWLMWYAERTAHSANLAPIAPPVAHRKVDPKYFADAVADRREGSVQLFCVIGRDGTVSAIEVLKGFDLRLDQSARDALAKWEFYPATRQDEPVEVEVLVEIPFRLAPRTAKP